MNQSRIEQNIEEIYAFVEACKTSKLYPNKVVLAKDELYDLLDALRLCAPEEIKRYKKIINNRDEILTDAHKRAEEMLTQAQSQTAQLLDQSELVQAAYDRANEIMEEAAAHAKDVVEQANAEADQIRNASLYYTNDLLTGAQKNLKEALNETNHKYRMLVSALQSSLDIIESNKEELRPTTQRKEEEIQPQEQNEELAAVTQEKEELQIPSEELQSEEES